MAPATREKEPQPLHIGINTLAAHRMKTGIATYVSGLVDGLTKVDRENRYSLFVSYENAGLFPEDGPSRRKVFGPRIIDNTNVRVLWEHTFLAREIRRRNIDVLHSPTFVSPAFCRIPSVITIPDMNFFLYPAKHPPLKRWYFHSCIPRAARRAQKVIAISENTRQDVLRILGLSADKVVTVYCGVNPRFKPVSDEEALKRIRKKYGLDRSFVLFLGMIQPMKNLVRLIQAFKETVRRGFTGVLVLAGPKGWGYVEAAAEVQRQALDGQVIFPGPIRDEELPGLLSAAEIFVYPSLYEGFGLPPLEAMACGVPVVVSSSSSLPEVVGDAGLVVDPLNVGELAAAMWRALTDSALRDQLRARGFEQAKRFTWEEAARQTLEVYKATCASGRELVSDRFGGS
jgi:glycosyltransferase involved in cell wall biosynthesis